MSAGLVELEKWFSSGTAEGERAILDQVFVYVEQFSSVMTPPFGSPRLLIGGKGSGKSAVLDFALRILHQQSVPAILLTPFDIDSSQLPEASSTGDMSRIFYSVLLASIAKKLSETSTGWFDGDRASLYYEAINTNQRTPDFAGKFGRFLAEVSRPLTKIDLNAAFPQLVKSTREELEGALARSLASKSFYVFIDDTDQIASPNKLGHLNRIWALMLAIRRLSSQVPEVKCAISLRNEVWQRLQSDEQGQRDQTDHFRSLCVYMISDREHVGKIVDRRLALAANAIEKPGETYAPFFEGTGARPPGSERIRSWRDLITVRSRERPRNAIQLVNMLTQKATRDRALTITEGNFRSIMPTFSQDVANEFAKEVALECPQALEILKTLSSVPYDQEGFTMSAEIAKTHFTKVLSRFGVVLYGQTLRQNNEADVFSLWRFFYLCNVINARVSDAGQKEQYRHLSSENDPSLVSKTRWNDLQAMLWEVNTVYRDYLLMTRAGEESRIGLPVKAKASNRRNIEKRR